MTYFLLRSVLVFVLLMGGWTHAAGVIPRDGLRLELMLATGAQDTSGNNRPITTNGITPIYKIDPIYGMPHVQFSGSGGLRVNTAWRAEAGDDFTISMWTKVNPQDFIFSGTQLTTDPRIVQEVRYGWGNTVYKTYNTFVTYPIFINSSGSINQNSLRVLLDAQGKCSIRGNAGPIDTFSYIYGYTSLGWVHAVSNVSLLDYGNNMSEKFDCAKLIDNKWHHIVLIKKAGILSFIIDGVENFKIAGNFEIGRDILLGYSNHFSSGSYTDSYLSPSQLDIIRNSHNSKAQLAGFRIYNRALNNDDMEALGDEYRYVQSDLLGAGDILLSMDKYTKPNLYIQLKSISPNLTKENVEYQYSTDGKSFSGIIDMTDISLSTGSIAYRAVLNLSSISDGKVIITLRIKSGDTYQNLGSVSFSKLDNPMNIIINQPNAEIASIKNISASSEAGNVIYMFQTRNTTCDNTITTWEEYSDLSFTSKNDNGIRVCYKAVNTSTNKTIYKLSTAIQGIQSSEDQKNVGFGLFTNYNLWTKSAYQRTDDSTSMMLDLLGVSAGASQGTINGVTMTDINGDGLVDFLYSRNDPIRRAIIINNGNYTFKTVYKCVFETIAGYWSYTTYIPTTSFYYGDCADQTR